MESAPIKPHEFIAENLKHSALKLNKSKDGTRETKQVRISYGPNNTVLRVKVPSARLPFGLTTSKDDPANPSQYKKYSISISLDNENPELKKFTEMLKKLDEINLKQTMDKCKEWWGETKISIDAAKERYESMVKYPKDETSGYSPTFKIKLNIYKGEPAFLVYDENNRKMKWYSGNEYVPSFDWSWAEKNSQVETVIDCEGLYIVNKKVYCCFRAYQVKSQPPKELGCCFGDEVDNVPTEVEETKEEEDIPKTSQVKKAPLKVEDDSSSDDEEE